MKLTNKYIDIALKNNLGRLIREGRETLLPPLRMPVSEWADKNRVLPETSAEPGRWRTSRTPHLKDIMNKVNDPEVSQISVMASAQIGKTEFINNVIGYKIDLDPCAIMVMQPTEKDARDYVQQKLEPMLEDTPCLREKVAKKKSRDADNSMFRKKFIGGYLLIVSGNSPSATRSRSIKLTIADDIDAIPILYQREGDPIMRLMKRSTAFFDGLNINISTPTRDGMSRIQFLYENSNQQKYYVRCPHCNTQQLLEEERLHWEKERDMFGKIIKHYPETASYSCISCKVKLDEHTRLQMLNSGEWIADRKYITAHQGFWINELSSPLSSMRSVVRQIIEAGVDIEDNEIIIREANEEKIEALFNTVFGRPYQAIKGEEIEPLELMERVEDYITKDNKLIPNEVLLITASVDVQAGSRTNEQRLELNVWGWGEGEEAWLLYRTRIPGNIRDTTTDRSPWLMLNKYFQMKYKRQDGIELPVQIKTVDSGYESQVVYEYCAQRLRENIYAIKGAQRYGADLLPRKATRANKGRTPLLIIGTQAAKTELYGRLKNIKESGPKCIHFPKLYCDAEYFKQITAEHGIKKYQGLLEYVVYEKKKKSLANEAIDLMVYAYCAMKILSPNWSRLKESIGKRYNISVPVDNTPNPEPPIRKPLIIKKRSGNFAKYM